MQEQLGQNNGNKPSSGRSRPKQASPKSLESLKPRPPMCRLRQITVVVQETAYVHPLEKPCAAAEDRSRCMVLSPHPPPRIGSRQWCVMSLSIALAPSCYATWPCWQQARKWDGSIPSLSLSASLLALLFPGPISICYQKSPFFLPLELCFFFLSTAIEMILWGGAILLSKADGLGGRLLGWRQSLY